MAEISRIRPSGEVIAAGVTYEDFLKNFDGQHVEWVYGDVIKMPPVTEDHNDLSVFLITLLSALLSRTGGGRVFHDPMMMRPGKVLPARAPDIQIVLPENAHIIQENEIAGAADPVIEIVSPGSHRRDRVEKFHEYEQAGVKEYWILDPIRRETLFYQRNENGLYEHIPPDANGIYHSKVLPQLKLSATIFWNKPLPGHWEIGKLVDEMLKDGTK